MLFFKSLKFAKQPIVFRVGQLGVVQHVIRVVGAVQYLGQMPCALANVVLCAAQRPLPSSWSTVMATSVSRSNSSPALAESTPSVQGPSRDENESSNR